MRNVYCKILLPAFLAFISQTQTACFFGTADYVAQQDGSLVALVDPDDGQTILFSSSNDTDSDFQRGRVVFSPNSITSGERLTVVIRRVGTLANLNINEVSSLALEGKGPTVVVGGDNNRLKSAFELEIPLFASEAIEGTGTYVILSLKLDSAGAFVLDVTPISTPSGTSVTTTSDRFGLFQIAWVNSVVGAPLNFVLYDNSRPADWPASLSWHPRGPMFWATRLLGVSTNTGANDLCSAHDAPQTLGNLNIATIDEASGMVVSKEYADRLYFINDSGDGSFLYATDKTGGGTATIGINGLGTPLVDQESLGYGACPQLPSENCVYIFDIGDNAGVRNSLQIVTIRETDLAGPPATVNAHLVQEIQYPNNWRENAEAAEVDELGNVWIITKLYTPARAGLRPQMLFKLDESDIDGVGIKTLDYFGTFSLWHRATPGANPWTLASQLGSLTPTQIATLTPVDPQWPIAEALFWKVITGMSIGPSGSSFAVMTYGGIVEFSTSLSSLTKGSFAKTMHNAAYQAIATQPFAQMPQKEALTYDYDFAGGRVTKDLLYTTERVAPSLAPLGSTVCNTP